MDIPGILKSISSNPFYSEFWQGATSQTARPVAKFLAPVMRVPALTFHYKQRGADFRTQEVDYSYRFGRDVIDLGYALNTIDAEVTPRAANIPLDNLNPDSADYLVKQAFITMAVTAAEDAEKRTLCAAVAAAGNAASVSFSQSADDPISTLDDSITDLLLSGQSQEAGIIFGVEAFKLFKANPNVRAATRGNLSYVESPSIFIAETPWMVSTAYKAAAPGTESGYEWVFPANGVLIFTRTSEEVTDGDSSAMKNFVADPASVEGTTQKPLARITLSKDGRRIVVCGDWTSEPLVTSLIGFSMLNAT